MWTDGCDGALLEVPASPGGTASVAVAHSMSV